MTLTELARHPRLRKGLVLAAAAVAVWAAFGFLAVPPLVRSLLANTLTRSLHRRTTVEGVAFNPFALSVRVRGLTVREPESNEVFVSLAEAYANVKLTSVLHLAPVLKELRLRGLHIRIVRNEDSSYNFSDLLAKSAPPPAGPSKPLRYALNNIQLLDGSLDFDDRPVHKVHTVRNAYIAIPFLSNLPDDTEVFTQPAVRAVVNGTMVALDGRTKPFSGSRETSLDVDIRDLDVPPYLAYLPVPIRVKVLSARLGTRLTLTFRQEKGSASRLVLAGRATLRDVAIADAQGGGLIELPMLDVRVAAADLLTRRIGLASVLIQRPRVRVARDVAGAWNLADLVPPSAPQAAQKGEAASRARFVLDVAEFKMSDGTLTFEDAAARPPFSATLRALEFDVRGFSTAPGTAARTELSLTSDAGEALRQAGELTFEPLNARGTVEITGVPLRRYAAYYRDAIAFEVADGVLGLSTGYAWSGAPGGGLGFSGLAATLRSLHLRRAGEREGFLLVREAALEASALDLAGRSATLGGLTLTGVRLTVARGKDGVWSLTTLLPASPGTGAAPAAEPSQTPAAPTWTWSLGRLSVKDTSVEVDDGVPERPVSLTLAPLTLVASDLSAAEGRRGRLDLRCVVNGAGSVALRGDVGLNPITARLGVDVKELPLVPLQGYATDRFHLVVSDGAASSTGEVTVAAGGEGPSVGFVGRASVDRLAAVDAYAAEDLLKWDSLTLERIEWASRPFHLEIGEIDLAGLGARVAIAPDGTTNLRRVLGGAPEPDEEEDEGELEGAPAPATPAQAAPPPSPTATPALEATASAAPDAGAELIRIGRLVFRGGAVTFVDSSVSPQFLATITGLEGSISGLSSLGSTAGDVDLRATVNGQAPLSIKGKVNPLAGNLVLDVTVAMHDLDLPGMSAYSGTYAGYAVQRGKLSLDLAYKVAARRLDAQNHLFLDQFDFGERVESPKATHLPVRLAVSLLKDRKEQIRLDLPVSGSLDDPKFRIGRVILKMIGNLLVKVASSPFALLGSIFGGGGADLDTVGFAPGSAVLDDGARARLDTLGKALNDRPALRLELTGRTDPGSDRDGLRQAALQRAVKREKLDDLVKSGGTASSLDAVTVAPGEYETYLTRAYRHGKFSKPHNLLGMVKAQPVGEMERRLLASLEPGPDALRDLAAARAQAVQSYLLQTAKVQAAQVFVVTAPSAAAPAGKGSPTRVDLALR